MSESYLVIKDRYLGISVTLRSGSRYEISIGRSGGRFCYGCARRCRKTRRCRRWSKSGLARYPPPRPVPGNGGITVSRTWPDKYIASSGRPAGVRICGGPPTSRRDRNRSRTRVAIPFASTVVPDPPRRKASSGSGQWRNRLPLPPFAGKAP